MHDRVGWLLSGLRNVVLRGHCAAVVAGAGPGWDHPAAARGGLARNAGRLETEIADGSSIAIDFFNCHRHNASVYLMVVGVRVFFSFKADLCCTIKITFEINPIKSRKK